MKYLKFILVFFLLSPIANAVESMDAHRVCSRIKGSDSYRLQCYELIRNAVIDQLAAGVCDRYDSPRSEITCMQSIVNRRFSHPALLVCNKDRDEDKTNDCLNVIADRFMQEEATAACDRLEDARPTTNCLAAIAGKKFSDDELADCQSIRRPREKIACFADSGALTNEKISSLAEPMLELANFPAHGNAEVIGTSVSRKILPNPAFFDLSIVRSSPSPTQNLDLPGI